MSYTPAYRAAILEDAAHSLEIGGWCRGTYVDTDGHACLMGAIRLAAEDQFGLNRDKIRAVIEDLISDPVIQTEAWGLETSDRERILTGWNDFKVRDKRRVIRLLRRVARNLRKQAA